MKTTPIPPPEKYWNQETIDLANELLPKNS